MMRSRPITSRSHCGFALFEVMIALLVLVLGLLSVARLQAMTARNTQLSGKRALVAQAAGSLAASLHGNRPYWASGAAPTTVTISPSAVTDSSGQLGSAPAGGCSSTTGTACTSTQIAALDLANWRTNLAAQLPTFTTATITVNNGASPPSAVITVNWTETFGAANANGAQSGGAIGQSYTLSVLP